MKFRVETTIPQRQFENLKTSYEIDTKTDLTTREDVIKMALEDLKKYNQIVQKDTPEPFFNPKEGEVVVCNGIRYIFKDGTWNWEKA